MSISADNINYIKKAEEIILSNWRKGLIIPWDTIRIKIEAIQGSPENIRVWTGMIRHFKNRLIASTHLEIPNRIQSTHKRKVKMYRIL